MHLPGWVVKLTIFKNWEIETLEQVSHVVDLIVTVNKGGC